eukprot:scaffold462_cov195-Pinguiococcus_pyrenoidosus.AAC.62
MASSSRRGRATPSRIEPRISGSIPASLAWSSACSGTCGTAGPFTFCFNARMAFMTRLIKLFKNVRSGFGLAPSPKGDADSVGNFSRSGRIMTLVSSVWLPLPKPAKHDTIPSRWRSCHDPDTVACALAEWASFPTSGAVE